jgi:hypothetical protein
MGHHDSPKYQIHKSMSKSDMSHSQNKDKKMVRDESSPDINYPINFVYVIKMGGLDLEVMPAISFRNELRSTVAYSHTTKKKKKKKQQQQQLYVYILIIQKYYLGKILRSQS